MFSYAFDITSLILQVVWCKRNRVRLSPCWNFWQKVDIARDFLTFLVLVEVILVS